MPSRFLLLLLPALVALNPLRPSALLAEAPPVQLSPIPISAIPDPPLPRSRPQRPGEEEGPAGANASNLPLSELQCRRALDRAGARFTEEPALHEPEEGCRIDHPVRLESLGGGVALDPPALINCPLARATVEFMHAVVVPAAKRHFDAAPATLVQMSGYVCRSRHGSDTVSEHATGNALDWGAIVLDDGETVEVREHGLDETPEQDFLDEIREAACGPFTTVLGPGTDADHADHFHFDLAERGAPYCR